MTDVWDFIVVGGGHNGLSAACTIAAAGKSVLVLEQRPILGSLANSHAFLPEAPGHILSIGAMDDLFMSSTSLSSDLGLPAYGHRSAAPAAPYGWLGDDGETLLLFRDFDRTLREIRRWRPTGKMCSTSVPTSPPRHAMAGPLRKKWYSEAIMRVAARHLTGLECEIGRVETSPADFEAMFGTPNSNYFHVDMTPLRYGMNRPAPGLGGYRTPVRGFYLAAAGSHPGGGVSGWPGRLAAQTALSDT